MLAEIEFLGVDEGVKNRILNFCNEFEQGRENFSIYTSGSSGVPKEIVITREQMIHSAQMTQDTLGLEKGMHSFVCLNTDFIGGKMMLVRAMVTGMKITVVMPTSEPFKELPASAAFDFGSFVPYQMYHMLAVGDAKNVQILNHFKNILVGGDMVNYELEQHLQKIAPPVYHTFGMTETVSHFALRKVNGSPMQKFYKLLPGVEVRTDVRNCLRVKSMVTGNEWLTTNDIVEIVLPDKKNPGPQGLPLGFIWKGRIDNVINSGGIKIQLEEVEGAIEKVFFKLKISNRFFVAGLKDLFLNQKLTLFVETDKAFDAKKEKNVKAELEKLLMKYQVPRSIVYTERFKETLTGKIMRTATIEDKMGPEGTEPKK